MDNHINNPIDILSECLDSLRELSTQIQDDVPRIKLNGVIAKLMRLDKSIAPLQVRVQEAEKKIKECEAWDKNVMDYDSYHLHSGCWIVISKKPDESAYAKEWHCKNCFNSHEITTLQPELQSVEYVCPSCDKKIWLDDQDENLLRAAKGLPPLPPGRAYEIEPHDF